MVTVRTRQELPDIAKPTADLIERLGFKWVLDVEYPLSNLNLGKRVQIRDEKHLAPRAQVTQYAAAMKRGDKFAPIVITKDGYYVDGATRMEAAKRNGFPTIQAFMLDVSNEDVTDAARVRLHALGAGFNARNGKGIDRKEIADAVEIVGSDPSYDATRIAALIGVTEGTVRHVLAEHRARQRAGRMGLTLNGSIQASQLRKLGQVSDKLNDEPWKAATRLVSDTGMTVEELNDLLKQMRETSSDDAAMAVVGREREARSEQIATYRASGKSRPPESAKLRRALGSVLGPDPKTMIERSPNLTAEHLDTVERAIVALQAVAAEQRRFNASIEG